MIREIAWKGGHDVTRLPLQLKIAINHAAPIFNTSMATTPVLLIPIRRIRVRLLAPIPQRSSVDASVGDWEPAARTDSERDCEVMRAVAIGARQLT